MSFPEVPPDPPVEEVEYLDGPMVVCASCGADWSAEPCDVGCPNDVDTAAKAEAALLP